MVLGGQCRHIYGIHGASGIDGTFDDHVWVADGSLWSNDFQKRRRFCHVIAFASFHWYDIVCGPPVCVAWLCGYKDSQEEIPKELNNTKQRVLTLL